jgi:hypothetical protein
MKINGFAGAVKNKPNQTQTNSKRVGWGLYPTNSSISNVTFQNGASRGFCEKRQKFIRLRRIYVCRWIYPPLADFEPKKAFFNIKLRCRTKLQVFTDRFLCRLSL